tara:strand:+ start:322 stop:531 length:210 start_codon:yes stop_codon:yes gene_type:complete
MELVSIVAPVFVIAVTKTLTDVDPSYDATIAGTDLCEIVKLKLSEEESANVTVPVSIVILSKPAIYDPT